MVAQKEINDDQNLKLMGFLVTLAVILVLVGWGLRSMFATVDDAAFASMDTVKSAFAERVQTVHVYWINNGKKKTQYLDVSDLKHKNLRVAYELSENGWPRDAHFLDGDQSTYGEKPCERLMETVVPNHSAEIIKKMSSQIKNYEHGCIFLINENKLKYSFLTGEISLVDLMPERNDSNIYFK